MSVTVRIDQFEGPLDLLLQLIERDELDISEISLATVADQYVQYVRENHGSIPPAELADFLVVAAKLVYLKSRLLIPSLEDEELDEGPDLASQLRLYQRFVAVASVLNEKWNEGAVSYRRQIPKTIRKLEIEFNPPKDVGVDTLESIMHSVIKKLTPVIKAPQAAVRRIIRIQDKIADLASRLRKNAKMTFSGFIKGTKDKQERLVSFLALLELVKQRVVTADQTELFEDIDIAANDLDRLADLKIEFV